MTNGRFITTQVLLAKAIGVALLAWIITACGSHNKDKDRTPETVYEALLSKPEFSTFAGLLNESGLKDELLNSDTRFTVFAPTDEALTDLPMEMRHAIMRDPALEILKYHLVRDMEIDAVGAVVIAGERIVTEEGRALVLSQSNSQLYVNTAMISGEAAEARNGVVHPITKLLVPPAVSEVSTLNILDTLKSDNRFATFVDTLEDIGLSPMLADASKTFTVFAPDENGFPYFPPEILGVLAQTMTFDELRQFILERNTETLQSYIHVGSKMDSLALYGLNDKTIQSVNNRKSLITIDDDGLNIGGGLVIEKDIQAANGIIHVVGRPILTEDE